MNSYRQGDILLIPTTDKPVRGEERSTIPSGVIAVGESTGHAHRIIDGEVQVDRSGMFVIAGGSTQLVHDEHDTIEIPEGTYRVRRQREVGQDGSVHFVAD